MFAICTKRVNQLSNFGLIEEDILYCIILKLDVCKQTLKSENYHPSKAPFLACSIGTRSINKTYKKVSLRGL